MSNQTSSHRAANGQGNIRQRTKTGKNGVEYTYWEGRVTISLKDGRTEKHYVSGKTQHEVLEKMQKARVEATEGSYVEPSKITVSQWLDTWLQTYLNDVKPRTVEAYTLSIQKRIKPALGDMQLQKLDAPAVQRFYNGLSKPHDGKSGLSAKTIHCVHGVLHSALKKAVEIGYLRTNPTEACTLPRKECKEIKPLDTDDVSCFLKAIRGNPYEDVFIVTVFTGLRQGEALGLTWDAVNFERGTIRINKQLQKVVGEKGKYQLVSTKNSKGRIITPAPFVMDVLRKVKVKQNEARLLAGKGYKNQNFVFSNPLGQHFMPSTVYHHFKRIAESIGLPETRFHDLRHTYAVAALANGDDIKTVQENLGHHTASFTLDVYGHVTDQMRKESANRMENFIRQVRAK